MIPKKTNDFYKHKSLSNEYETVIWKEEKGVTRKFISAGREWKDSVYYYNKNNVKTIAARDNEVARLVRGYFNLSTVNKNVRKSKRMRDLIRRSSVNKLFSSKPEIKQTSDKAYVTVYLYNNKKRHILRNLCFSRLFVPRKYKYTHNKKILSMYIRKMYHLRLRQQRNIRRSNILRHRFSLLKLNMLSYGIMRYFKQMRYVSFYRYMLEFLNKKVPNFLEPIHYVHDERLKKVSEAISDTQTWENSNISKAFPTDEHANKNTSLNTSTTRNIMDKPLLEKNKSLLATICMDENKRLQFLSYMRNQIKQDHSHFLKKKEEISEYLSSAGSKKSLIRKLMRQLVRQNKLSLGQKGYVKMALEMAEKNSRHNRLIKPILDRETLLKTQYKLVNTIPSIKHLLERYYNKKVILNIVNLKYLHLNSDNLMEAVAIKLTKQKSKLLRILRRALKITRVPKSIDLKPNNNSLLLNVIPRNSVISDRDNTINDISYKSTTGIRLEAKGRLTKRYTASRALFKFRYKGSLKNLEPSKNPDKPRETPSMFMVRGYIRPNIQHTFAFNKRRIGAFGLKGWLSNN